MAQYSQSQIDLLHATHDLPPEEAPPRYKYTCAHCRYGYVPFLPCECPECGVWLNEPVKKEKDEG